VTCHGVLLLGLPWYGLPGGAVAWLCRSLVWRDMARLDRGLTCRAEECPGIQWYIVSWQVLVWHSLVCYAVPWIGTSFVKPRTPWLGFVRLPALAWCAAWLAVMWSGVRL